MNRRPPSASASARWPRPSALAFCVGLGLPPWPRQPSSRLLVFGSLSLSRPSPVSIASSLPGTTASSQLHTLSLTIPGLLPAPSRPSPTPTPNLGQQAGPCWESPAAQRLRFQAFSSISATATAPDSTAPAARARVSLGHPASASATPHRPRPPVARVGLGLPLPVSALAFPRWPRPSTHKKEEARGEA